MMSAVLQSIVLLLALVAFAGTAFSAEISDLQIRGVEGIKVLEMRNVSFIFKANKPPDDIAVRYEGKFLIE